MTPHLQFKVVLLVLALTSNLILPGCQDNLFEEYEEEEVNRDSLKCGGDETKFGIPYHPNDFKIDTVPLNKEHTEITIESYFSRLTKEHTPVFKYSYICNNEHYTETKKAALKPNNRFSLKIRRDDLHCNESMFLQLKLIIYYRDQTLRHERGEASWEINFNGDKMIPSKIIPREDGLLDPRSYTVKSASDE